MAILFLTDHNTFKPISIIPFLLIFLSCASILPKNNDVCSLHWTEKDQGPKTVVILPFDNNTSEKDVELLARKSFYNYFSSKTYHDFELSEIDRALKSLKDSSSQAWKDLSPVNLGNLFHSDYLIYGRVEEFKKLFLGVYSQIAIKIKIEVVEGRSGKVVCKKTILKRSHDGGIPFNPFGIIPAALRSGLHMKKEKTLALIDRANRELVAQIPDPPALPASSFMVEIQVASFSAKKRAVKTLEKFKNEGLTARIESVILGDSLWYRVIIGPYNKRSEAEKIRNKITLETRFQPVFIHHHPEKNKEGS